MFRPLVGADVGQAGVIDDLSNLKIWVSIKNKCTAVAANLSSFSVSFSRSKFVRYYAISVLSGREDRRDWYRRTQQVVGCRG